jgi:cell fate (sporulation/competence/biofilm development) regulator YmcA (YheA/YmcA/DUF963 family)
MVPISEYATVNEGATLYDAIQALEKAQEDFQVNKYAHRAILILNKNQQVVGKLSQLNVLRALQPKNIDLENIAKLSKYGFSEKFIQTLQTEKRLQGAPLSDLCENAARLKVEDFMQAPTEGEYIGQEAPLELAVNQLVFGKFLSLLVTEGKKIVGILRLTDVFGAVFHAMQECQIK